MPPSALTLQRTIFWANLDDDAFQYACRLTGWRHALSADPSVDPETGKPYYKPTIEQVNALKNGAKLTVTGTSKRGTVTTDTYSLIGITAALAKLATECP